MMSAREFYNLQRIKKQSKLENNPRVSLLLEKVAEKLNQKNYSKDAEKLLHPVLSNSLSPPTKTDGKKRKRKKPKKRNNVSESGTTFDGVPSEHAQPVPDTRLQPSVNSALSRSQRKKLRKRLKKQEKEKYDSTQDHPVLDTSKNEVPVQKRLRSPTESMDLPPAKKVCSPKNVNAAFPEPSVQPSCIESTERSAEERSQEHLTSPVDMGKSILQSLLEPVNLDDFFMKYFEKQPLFVRRHGSQHHWLSTLDVDRILKTKRVMFTEHLDLACYEDGKRYTLNPPGRAFRSVVWDHYNTGCSVRLLCPQVFFKHIRRKLSLLQEYFGCFVGSNVYLTPPGSQGFAPHYDDIEAFILQLEGTKRWSVYAPRHQSEKLPRYSSPNFAEEELGKPVLTVTLNPGDLLYLPRGYIHQAETTDESHSLHITISTYQKHSWGDFMEKLLPIALRSAMETNAMFREGLPIGFLRHVGGFSVTSSEHVTEFRKNIVNRLRILTDWLERGAVWSTSTPSDGTLQTVSEHVSDPLLTAADLFAVDQIGHSLPPQLLEEELACHVQEQGEHWIQRELPKNPNQAPDQSNRVVNVVELDPDTRIRLVRWSTVRSVRTRILDRELDNKSESASDDASESNETDTFVAVYHSYGNTNVYEERQPEELALDVELLPALDHLANVFPNFVKVDDLPLPDPDSRLRAACGLYEAGLVITEFPLTPIEQSDSFDESDDETVDSEGNISELDSEDSTHESVESDPDDLVPFNTGLTETESSEEESERVENLLDLADQFDECSSDSLMGPVKSHCHSNPQLVSASYEIPSLPSVTQPKPKKTFKKKNKKKNSK